MILLPTGKAKVAKTLTLQESRINDVEQIRALYAPRDHVFRERLESFHWIANCIDFLYHAILLDSFAETGNKREDSEGC